MPQEVPIAVRRGTVAAWRAANPIPDSGEPIYETDTHKARFGDGTTAFNSLGFPIVPRYNDIDGDPRRFTLSQDTEKFVHIDDFLNNTSGQYTITGSVTWSSGKMTFPAGTSTPKIIKTTSGTEKYGVYRSVFRFVSAPGAGQRFNPLYVSSTLWVYVTYYMNFRIGLYHEGGTSVIAETDTGVPLDTNSHKIKLNYASTGYTIYFDDVQIGSETASTLVPTSIGAGCNSALSGGSTVEVSWLSFIPSVTFSDSYSSDTEARYHQLASSDLSTWAAAAAGDVAVSGGALVLASDDDRGLCAVVRSYNFKSGEIECSFDNNNDGGGGADTCCLLFGYQDINNYYRLALEDDTAGAENLKLYKVVAGSATQIGTTKDVSATYTRSNKTWIKVQWDSEKGRIWAWLRDNAGTYPTTPDISDAFSAAFSMGKVGYRATVTTAGAGNLNVAFDDLTIRCNCLVGETNVPATETGFYVKDEYAVNDIGRYTALTPAVWSVTGGVLRYTSAGAIMDNIRFDPAKCSILDVTADIIQGSGSSASSQSGIIFCWDGVNNKGSDSRTPNNAYVFLIDERQNVYVIRKIVAGTQTALTTVSYTFDPATPYTLRVVYNPTTDTATFYIGGVAVQSNFSLGAGFTSGYVGYYVYGDTGVNYDFDNLIINGTRYYFKPMLRGAQLGEWWDGTKSVYCTRFTDDYDWNSIGEYTGVSTSAVDTANGYLTLSDTTYIYPAGPSFSAGSAHVTLLRSAASGSVDFTFCNNVINITYAGAVAFNGGAAESWSVDALSSAARIMFYASGTSMEVWSNGVLKGTKTGLTLATSNFKMKRNTADFYVLSLQVNGYDSTAKLGLNLTLGGVPHGARYDTQEAATFSFTNLARYGKYFLIAAAKTTNASAEDAEFYFRNLTDTSNISLDATNTLDISLSATTPTDFTKELLLDADDRGDTITLQARRKTAATDNSAAVFVEYASILPSMEVGSA